MDWRRRRLFIVVAGGGGGGIIPLLTAPVLTWVSGTTDNTPDLTAVFPDILPVGTDITFEYADNSLFTSATSTVHDITNPEAVAQEVDLALSALADGTWYIRVKYEGSAWSNTVTKTIDAAPTLTNADATATGQTTIDMTVDTDQSGGTLYWVVTTSATPPSASQVKAGQNNGGSAAVASGNQAIASTGTKTPNATGLTAGTNYYAYFMHEDAGAHQSNVAASGVVLTNSGVVRTFRGSTHNDDGFGTLSMSVDIGTAAADRLVVVGVTSQNDIAISSVVVNGVTLTQDKYDHTNPTAAIYSGVVASGSGVVTATVNLVSAAFLLRSMIVYTITGLSSTSVKHVSSGISPILINADAGDNVIEVNCPAGTFTSYTATETPDDTHSEGGTSIFSLQSAEWTVDATNASFSINSNVSSTRVATSYR